jgi:hypothetical protein
MIARLQRGVNRVADREDIDRDLSDLDDNRREFIKRISIGAIAAPVIASFSMDALGAAPAYAQSNSS